MSTFPALNYLSNSARTEGEMKTAFEDLLGATKQIPGCGILESTLTLATDQVTPGGGVGGIFSVDTEGAAGTDDLKNIIQTNFPDGSVLYVRSVSASRTVVLKHSAGGAGQLSLRGGADVSLTDPKEFVAFKRTGALWEELQFKQTYLRAGSVGPHAIGGATVSTTQFLQTGSFAGDRAYHLASTITPGLNTSGYGLVLTPTLVEHSSGTHPLMAGAYIAPIMTAGVGVTTTFAGLAIDTFTAQSGTVNAAGLYVIAAPTGATNNRAAWIVGRTDVDGTFRIGSATSEEDLGTGLQRVGSDTIFWYGTGTTGDLYFKSVDTGSPGNRLILSTGGILALGTTVTTSATAGDLVMTNNQSVRWVNGAGTDTLDSLRVNSANQLVLGNSAADIVWGKALVALGGGAAPTLGTIGGSGPATAAQNSWMRVIDSSGAAFWVPAWK